MSRVASHAGVAGRPTGTVTFVFTDIEGSTRLARRLGSAFAQTLERHRTLVREALAAGAEVDAEGDALFYAFARPLDALHAAAEAQRLLAREPWPDGEDVRVRVGVHAGAAELVDGRRYVGLEVHRAARICAAAHGGQVVVSNAVAALCRELPEGLSLRYLGQHRLKDFGAADLLYQLCAPDLVEAFPPLRTNSVRLVSLPREHTQLLGRERECGELRDILRVARLVTLVGTGGSGKTRLAVRLAHALCDEFVDGMVVFLPLADVGDVEHVVALAARALAREGLLGSWADLAATLAGQPALLVVDNAEHLADLPVRVAELLDRCDLLRVVATSRTPLGIAGEQLYPVEPLPAADALALLLERARQQRPRFDPDEAELRSLEAVVERLDGLPLAVELAAARLRVLSAAALLQRLDRQLDVLAERRADLPERQRSMRAALDWSYELLEGDERALFRALSTFAAPARLEAVAAAWGRDDLEALDVLSRLVDASLVRVHGADDPRYGMLEPLRQYAAERLRTEAADDDPARRMAAWYLQEAEARSYEWGSLVRFLRNDLPNVQRAYATFTERADWVAAVRLLYATRDVFWVLGLVGLVEPWVADLQANASAFEAPEAARLAILEWRAHPNTALPRLERALRLARESGEAALLGVTLVALASRVVLDDPERAGQLLAEVERLEALPTLVHVQLLDGRARLASVRREAAAGELWERALDAARASGDDILFAETLNDAAWFAVTGRGPSDAHALAEEALTVAVAADVRGHEYMIRHTASQAALVAGRPFRAAAHLLRLVSLSADFAEADRLYSIALVLHPAVAVLAQCGRPEAAARLYGAIAPRLGQYPHEVFNAEPMERLIDAARAALGATRWSALLAEAAERDPGVALDRAVEELSELAPASLLD